MGGIAIRKILICFFRLEPVDMAKQNRTSLMDTCLATTYVFHVGLFENVLFLAPKCLKMGRNYF